MKISRIKISCKMIVLICVFFSVENGYANSPLGRTWKNQDQISIENINHDDYDALLKKYVNQEGRVNYQAWKASRKDRQQLLNYLAHLSQANPTLRASKEARLAYWINAYNAVTIEGIMQVYPTTSIRNHTAKIFGYNIWKDLYLVVGKDRYSLEQIEHEVLRKMNEPRIHFAIVCASIGCPRLMNRAYTTSNVEEMLKENATDFFANSQNFRVDRSKKRIYLSSILDWFKEDFGSSQVNRFKYLQPYIPMAYQKIVRDPNMTVYYNTYNWNLNKQ